MKLSSHGGVSHALCTAYFEWQWQLQVNPGTDTTNLKISTWTISAKLTIKQLLLTPKYLEISFC
jgi:hypothetical protein